MIGLLARHGAALDAPGRDGWTALALASRSNAADTVRALLEAGADVHAVGGNGKSAIETAAANGKASIVELLQAVSVSKA